MVAVIWNNLAGHLSDFHRTQLDWSRGRNAVRRCNHRRADIGLWQVKRKNTSLPGGAGQLDLAAEQTRQLATDSESQTSAAVLAAGAGIGLLKCLEDDALFLWRNANAGIRDFECHNRSC